MAIKKKATLRDDIRGRKALEQITKSVRSLATLKITLPLGNPSLKNVHTNQFLWTDLPKEFKLANFGKIAKGLNSSDSRYSGYEEDRWYIEGVTINNDGSKFTMDLDVNPFASSFISYRDAKQSFTKAYTDAINNKNNKNTNNNNNTTNKNSAASVDRNTTLKGGQGTQIDNLVKNWVGKETDPLQKAKKVHYGLREYGIRYAYYNDSRYYTPLNCLKHHSSPGLNCGDTAILTTACMLSAGLNAYIVFRCDHNHYFTRIMINGKAYHSDLTWSEGNLSQRAWNDTWEHNTCGNKYGNGTRIG